ncbi:MAG TPA: NDP-hexose 2,3-dehydratase family protein, partial [Micromonosporaceae bacterium]|nr:NDP-hexose 2,3-dehydratase family protein [Micromonosporaceae bacterium]
LGILLDRRGGTPRLLMQAKVEPGNVNTVQLSPTVQATPSNYTRVHGGPAPRYLEYFTDPGRGRRHVDVLQSEQGGWFFQKRNRNMLVEVTEDVPVHEDFRWVPLAEVRDLLGTDNVVNADARTVLSCARLAHPGAGPPRGAVGPFRSALVRSAREADRGPHTMAEVLHWITELRSRYHLEARLVPLDRVGGWPRGATAIERADGGTFRVVAVRVEATSREVARWTQPLVQPCGVGLTGFIVRAVGGVLQVLVQALVEPGNRDVVEVAPTVQHQPAGPAGPADGRAAPPFLDVLTSARPERIRFDAVQSDEGGRFYHSVNRHLVVEVDADFDPPLPDAFRWLTLHQLAALSAHSNYVNIQARSLLLCLYSLW